VAVTGWLSGGTGKTPAVLRRLPSRATTRPEGCCRFAEKPTPDMPMADLSPAQLSGQKFAARLAITVTVNKTVAMSHPVTGPARWHGAPAKVAAGHRDRSTMLRATSLFAAPGSARCWGARAAVAPRPRRHRIRPGTPAASEPVPGRGPVTRGPVAPPVDGRRRPS